MNKRHSKILSILSDGHQATVNELSDRLSVSPATVRQDLTSLEKQRFLRRVHGGAVFDESDDIAHRMGINYEKKMSIEKKRRLWRLGDCEVALDELLLLGCFVEIEGPDERTIADVQKTLGLSLLPHIQKSYAALMRKKRSQ